MQVVIDTNVLISALLWKGKLVSLYHLINQGKIILCFSKTTLDELITVIHYPHIITKARKEKINLKEVVKTLISNSILVHPREIPKVIEKDPFDNNFLAAALSSGAYFIISGDKHLLKIKEFKGIPIIAPKEFLRKYFKNAKN